MSRDFAKKSSSVTRRKKTAAGGSNARKKSVARTPGSPQGSGTWRWYVAGVLTGMFLSFLVYLGTLPPSGIEAGSFGQILKGNRHLI